MVKDLVRRRLSAFALLPFAALLAPRPAHAAALQQVTSFGDNPSNISMYLYVPAQLAASPPVVVALHYCSGTASAYFGGLASGMVSGADQYGYIMIFPQTTAYGACWDVFSTGSLSHGGGSDSLGIVSMVDYVVSQYSADPGRVFAVGSSSGAMMVNVLLGAYPDVFKAGASFSGVPFGCWVGADPTSGWNSACAAGQVSKTGAEWGDLVRAAYPGYTGTRPRIQAWQGDADQTISFNNFGEIIKEWTNVLNVSETPTTTEMNQPQANFTRTRYEDASGDVLVEAVREIGQPHLINVDAPEVIRFFGLDGSTSTSSTGAGSTGGATTGAGSTTATAGTSSSSAGATGTTAGTGSASATSSASGGTESTGAGSGGGNAGGSGDSTGCSCVVGPGRAEDGALGMLAAIAGGLLLSRRRRERASAAPTPSLRPRPDRRSGRGVG